MRKGEEKRQFNIEHSKTNKKDNIEEQGEGIGKEEEEEDNDDEIGDVKRKARKNEKEWKEKQQK